MATTVIRSQTGFKKKMYANSMSKLNRIAAASGNNKASLANNKHYQKELAKARKLRQEISKSQWQKSGTIHFDSTKKSTKTGKLQSVWRQKEITGKYYSTNGHKFRITMRQNKRKKKAV